MFLYVPPGSEFRENSRKRERVLLSLVTDDEIQIAVSADEAQIGLISVGNSVALTYSCYGEEKLIPGKVAEIFNISQDESYTVYIAPEETPEHLGLQVEVQID